MIDIASIRSAAAWYERAADAARGGRIGFFKGIWDIQSRYAESVAGDAAGYRLPSARDAQACLNEGGHMAAIAPIPVDAHVFAQAAAELSAYCVEQGAFEDDAAASLQAADWRALVEDSPVEVAGSNPGAYLDDLARRALQEHLADSDVVVSVASLALRPLLEPYASRAAGLIKAGLVDAVDAEGRLAHCPMCGGLPTVSYVGRVPGNDGNGKRLWCVQCGTSWDFERVRCPECGNRNQDELHYVSIEGDDAHRAYCCDACGSYLRTVFVGQGSLAPFSYEVEDVVMLDLDAAMASVSEAG
ncbi:MAG: formate dehydrogenase accessory protein FdhE [Slackia sp.]|nr:formate dehydrogenase accessory protein FdhE [Slackia sp.]